MNAGPGRKLFKVLIAAAGFFLNSDSGHGEEKPESSPAAPAFGKTPGIVATPLGSLPEEARAVVVSPDGRKIAMIGNVGSRQAVFVDGERGKLYDEIVINPQPMTNSFGGPQFTADGSRLLCVAREGKDHFVVTDGVESPAYDRILQVLLAPAGASSVVIGVRNEQIEVARDGKADGVSLMHVSNAVFSPDGKRFAYVAQSIERGEHAWCVVVDGVASKWANRRPEQGPVFSADSRHLAYVAAENISKGNGLEESVERVVLDEKAGPVYRRISHLQLSGDGSKMVYSADRPPRPDEADAVLTVQREQRFSNDTPVKFDPRITIPRVVVDHAELPIYPRPQGYRQTEAWAPMLSVSGRVALSRVKGAGHCVWVDGVESQEYNKVEHIAFSPDGRRVAAFMVKGQRYVLIDGVESNAFESIDFENFYFAPDGRGYSFTARTADGKSVFIRNGQPDAISFAGEVARSPDGKRIAFSGYTGKYADLKHHLKVEDKVYELPGKVAAGGIRFSPDGSRVACQLLEGGLWADGEMQPLLATQRGFMDPEFSPDGKHFAYTAIVSDPASPPTGEPVDYTSASRVIDGRPGPVLQLFYRTPQSTNVLGRSFATSFGNDGVGYFGRSKGTLYRLDIPAATLASLPTISELAEKKREAGILASKEAADKAAAEKAEGVAKEARAKAAAPFQIMRDLEGFAVGRGILVEGRNGKLYGATLGGRFESGQLFVVEKDGTGYRVAHTLEGPEQGLMINALVVAPDGKIYGSSGLDSGNRDPKELTGTIFCHDPATGKSENLYSSKKGQNDGWDDAVEGPLLSAISEDGILWGLCNRHSPTTIFRLDPKTKVLRVVLDNSFSEWAFKQENGRTVKRLAGWGNMAAGHSPNPDADKEVGDLLLVQAGKIYSITADGGRGDRGQVVSMNLDGADYKMLYDFAFKGDEGCTPSHLIAGGDGWFYGATGDGGLTSSGSLFALKTDGSECRVLTSFTREIGNVEAMTLSGGHIYYAIGNGNQIARVKTTGGEPETLHKFTDNVEDVVSLVVGADGNLYGATQRGGKHGQGVLFSLRLNGEKP